MAKDPKPRLVTGPIVRYVNQTSASIWVELSEGASLAGKAKALNGIKRPKVVDSRLAHTTPVNAMEEDGAYGRYYALIRFEDLKPGTLYSYAITAAYDPNEDIGSISGVRKAKGRVTYDLTPYAFNGDAPAFRTLPKEGKEALRVAFGSCRMFEGGALRDLEGKDTLVEYSKHLERTHDDRLTAWPHVLLLLGDQIYADDVAQSLMEKLEERRRKRRKAGKRVPDYLENTYSPNFKEIDTHLRTGLIDKLEAGTGGFQCQEFQEYAALYQAAWNDPDVRKLFAAIPTFMLPDDHEVANGWDITAGWHEQMLNDKNWAVALRGGLMAYWLYQGWGNVSLKAAEQHPILKKLEAAHVGDVLGDLGNLVDKQLDRSLHAPVYYTIPTSPPIIAIDARADREFVAPVTVKLRNGKSVVWQRHPDDMILGATQFAWLEEQLSMSKTAFLASSVPLFQTLLGDQIMAKLTRVLEDEWPDLLTNQDEVDAVESFLRKKDPDTWYAFPASVAKLLKLLSSRDTVVILAGDVHYSYVFDLRGGDLPERQELIDEARIIQAVSSPLRYPNRFQRTQSLIQYGGDRYLDVNDLWQTEEGRGDVSANHELRDPFLGAQPRVFPKSGVEKHNFAYTTQNVIARLDVAKSGEILLHWYSADGGDELTEVGLYPRR